MAFLKPFQVIQNIRRLVRLELDGVNDELDDSANKFELFVCHQLQSYIQHKTVLGIQRRNAAGGT